MNWLIEHLPRILAGALVLCTAWAALAGIVIILWDARWTPVASTHTRFRPDLPSLRPEPEETHP